MAKKEKEEREEIQEEKEQKAEKESRFSKMSRSKKITVVATVVLCILLVLAVAGYSLFFKGYYAGVRTKNAHKTNIRQMLCIHDWYGGTGVCQKCGLKCSHDRFDDDYNCVICGFHHVHNFVDGICTECGNPCEHLKWSKGYCADCVYRCTHPEWKDDVCTTCGLYCTHPRFEDGVCVICGIPCLHENWENGKCVQCGLECSHEKHDQLTCVCEVCGCKVSHHYVDGRCSCGAIPPFTTEMLSDNILGECMKKGSVTTVSYTTRKYAVNNEAVVKNMDIYTPYGYNPKQQYNVLILIHDLNGQYYDWTTNPITVGPIMCNPKNIYDNMISQKLCDPLIIVSITTLYDTQNGEAESGSSQMAREIREDILPYIVDHYSTYAVSSTAKSISEARDHFGIGGIGLGASYAGTCGLIENYDLFGNFAFFGGFADSIECASVINADAYADYSIGCLYVGTGEGDPARANCFSGFGTVTNGSSILRVNDNAYYSEVRSATHSWSAWSALIYNTLLVMFGAKTA